MFATISYYNSSLTHICIYTPIRVIIKRYSIGLRYKVHDSIYRRATDSSRYMCDITQTCHRYSHLENISVLLSLQCIIHHVTSFAIFVRCMHIIRHVTSFAIFVRCMHNLSRDTRKCCEITAHTTSRNPTVQSIKCVPFSGLWWTCL